VVTQPEPEAALIGWRPVAAIGAGTLLNPLNSSMIAVALVSLRRDFGVSAAAATWLISGFYLAGAIGYSLMGRLADMFGPRRVLVAGLALVTLTGAVAPLAPSFGWLVSLRVLQAFGTSAPFPAGLAIIRRADPTGRTPANALGALAITASVSAALGPVLGGFLVAAAGWQAVFLVNVPATLAGLALAFAWLPADGPGPELAVERGGRAAAVRGSIRRMDLPGVALFSGTLAALLAFLLSLPDGRRWWLLAVAIASGALLASRSLRAPEPFLDLRMLASNRALVGVYAQFAAINVVFYAVFFGLPLWLQEARGFHPAQAGLLLLPVAGVGVLATPVAAVLTRRGGPRPSMLIGAVGLTAGSLLLLAVGPTTPLMGLVAVSVVLGVPNGFNNLGLQAALYERAPRGLMGTAGGQFQTARYVGAVLSTALLGAAFGRSAGTADLHLIAWVLAGISAALVVAALVTRAGGPRPVEPGASA